MPDNLGSSLGATGLLKNTTKAMRTITGKVPAPTPVRKEMWACGEHPCPWSKKPYFWEKAVHTRNSVAAKPGEHQQDLAGALVWATRLWRGLTQRGLEELSVWENLGEPANLRFYTQKVVRE